MLFNNLISLSLFSHIKNLVSKMFAKFAHGLDVRIFQGFSLTLLAT
ncbi:hypothetical protein AOT82_977 [Psychrobacter sp. AntiMn-1]|nr:hypothetical protein AOT82_977 [Psychrobacter sp. AntiMn-1]